MASVIKADLDELVFRSRNKAYGSYELRKQISRRTIIGFIAASTFFVLAMATPTIISWLTPKEEEGLVARRKVSYAELSEPPAIDEKKPPPPPPTETPPPPPQKAQVKFIPPTIVKDKEAKPEETIVSVDTFKKSNVDAGVKNVEGDPNALFLVGEADGEGEGPVEIVEDKEPDAFAFNPVEKEPAPVNLDAIKAKIQFPPQAKEAGIGGNVVLRILVDREGNYSKHVVVRTAHPMLTNEVLKYIKDLKFTPGIQAGKPVKVWVTIPFQFKLL
jgi:periplasmic protein TonB